MTIADGLAAAINLFEGCKLIAYKDTGGVLTIGFGHTGPDVTLNQTISYPRAVQLLTADCAPLLSMVTAQSPVAAVYAASFGYNLGQGALHRLLTGSLVISEAGGSPAFRTFSGDRFGCVDARGMVQPGLVLRRTLEASMILLSGGIVIS